MTLIASFFKLTIRIPSWHTGRLWLMRLGYYKLNRPKEWATDWIWIIDHAVQIGSEKCLLILGIRQINLPDRPLKFSDLEPIELLPVTKSNGDIVYEQLKLSAKKTGEPMQIVSDHGSDVKSGIEKFCKNNNTIFTYDIKHKMACILKNELEKDIVWQSFIKQAAKTKRLLQQTELAFLSPPNQRSKARYMNVDKLVVWGLKTLDFFESNVKANKKNYDIEQVNKKLSWVKEFKEQLYQWNDILKITTSAEDLIRNRGLYNNAHNDLAESFSNNVFGSKVDKIKVDVINFVKSESLNAKLNTKLLGSSEIIESVFGKQKFIEKDQSKSGFTGLLLALPALVSETTAEIIEVAMKSTPVSKIMNWYKDNIGKSVQSKKLYDSENHQMQEGNPDQVVGVVCC